MIELESVTPKLVKFADLKPNTYFVLARELKTESKPVVYRAVMWRGEMTYAVYVELGVVDNDVSPTDDVHPLEVVSEKVKLKYMYGSTMEDGPECSDQYGSISDNEYEVKQ